MVNYRAHARNNKRPQGDRILILEDTNGDGKADTQKVYYQGRDVDAALGICVLGNRVIVTCAPNVIVFTDEDGDDKPDSRELPRKPGVRRTITQPTRLYLVRTANSTGTWATTAGSFTTQTES